MKRETIYTFWTERVTGVGFRQGESEKGDDYPTSREIWEEFVKNTTLQGTRYAFMKCRAMWSVSALPCLTKSIFKYNQHSIYLHESIQTRFVKRLEAWVSSFGYRRITSAIQSRYQRFHSIKVLVVGWKE